MENNEIVRSQTTGQVMIDGKPHRITIVVPPPQVTQLEDPSAQYTTAKSRGIPDQPLPQLRLPNPLSLTLSVIAALCLLVAASMFSIGLTSYSNSVERVDRQRNEPNYKF